MKIYIVVVKQPGTDGWIACDYVGDDPWELDRQEIFFSYVQAKEVFDKQDVSQYERSKQLYTFDV